MEKNEKTCLLWVLKHSFKTEVNSDICRFPVVPIDNTEDMLKINGNKGLLDVV